MRQNKRKDGANATDNNNSSTTEQYLLEPFEPGIDLVIPQGTNRLMRIQSGLSFSHSAPKYAEF